MLNRLNRILTPVVVMAVIVAVAAMVVGGASLVLAGLFKGATAGALGSATCSGQSRAEVQGLGPFAGRDVEIRAMSGTSDVCTASLTTADSGTEVLNRYRRQLRAQGWRVRVQSGRHWRENASETRGPCADDPDCRNSGHVDATRAGRCHAITAEQLPANRSMPDTGLLQSSAPLERTSIFIASGNCDQMRD